MVQVYIPGRIDHGRAGSRAWPYFKGIPVGRLRQFVVRFVGDESLEDGTFVNQSQLIAACRPGTELQDVGA